MRPILSIGLIALLLSTAGCANPVTKVIDKLTDDEPATSQQTTESTPAPVASPAGNTSAPTTAAAPAKAVAEVTRTVPAVHTENTATEESARPAAASSGKSILIKKSEFCLYLLEDGNIVQSKSKGIQKAAPHCEMMGSGFRLENLFVFLYITVYNADETSLGGSNLAAVSFPRKGVSKLSEFDAIVLLVVATGYLLAITQKK